VKKSQKIKIAKQISKTVIDSFLEYFFDEPKTKKIKKTKTSKQKLVGKTEKIVSGKSEKIK
jgi:hypothetical protein